jgi:hypothetical protein
MLRKTHRSKSHKRRHSRSRYTRKRGGTCPCAIRGQSNMTGGRGGMGGSELGHAYTTGASQTLYQMTGRTPGLSSGGSKSSKKRRQAELAAAAAIRNADRETKRRANLRSISRNAANEGKKRMTKKRHNNFKKNFVMGMPLIGYEGNEYKHLSRNEMKNKIREEALSKYVNMFGNNEDFNELNLELNNNNNNNNNNKNNNNNNNNNNNKMGNVILPGSSNPDLYNLSRKN